jgi:hypothetical protein
LLVCTYKCVHLNISSFEENQAGWHKVFGIPYWPEWPLLRKNLRKIMWMAFILIAPELGVAIAFDEYLKAKAAVSSARLALGKGADEVLTLTHGFYANMGGFAGVFAPAALRSDAGENLSGASAGEQQKNPPLQVLDLSDYGQYALS